MITEGARLASRPESTYTMLTLKRLLDIFNLEMESENLMCFIEFLHLILNEN